MPTGKLDITGYELSEEKQEEIARGCGGRCLLCKQEAQFFACYCPGDPAAAAAMEKEHGSSHRSFFFMLCEEDLGRVDIADAVEGKFYSFITRN